MDKPSSAGECMVCGKHVDKRYGGMGRYVAMCIDCWEKACSLDLLVRVRHDEAGKQAWRCPTHGSRPASDRGWCRVPFGMGVSSCGEKLVDDALSDKQRSPTGTRGPGVP